jgi:adenosylcobinamide kinase/adenosylcobinamide-phosphate guanylyltransferase
MKELILGGVRSGKSRLAEQRARSNGLDVIYIATAMGGLDRELDERIRRHRERRFASWTLVEEPLALGAVLSAHARMERCLVVDCLTLWVTNLLGAAGDRLERERLDLLQALPELPGHTILVSNETGLGVVPLGELSRRFIDVSGELHQNLARLCDRVTLVVAGLPVKLKDAPACDQT